MDTIYIDIILFIYLLILIKQRPKSRYHWVGAHQRQREKKERKGRGANKRKGIETQRVDLPNRAVDALIGDEEYAEKKNKTGSGPTTQLPWTIYPPQILG